MIDCLLLKSSAEPVKTLFSGRRILHFPEFVSSQRFEIIYQTHPLNLLRFTFEPFDSTALRGGHFSDFQLRVKRCFASFFTSFQNHPRAAFASPRWHGAHYREFLAARNTLFKKTYTFECDSLKFNRTVLFFNICRIILQQQRKFLCH